ncbi:MAG TPA: OsmC family protein [Gaiellaceae bacterium]|jgi:organic hydroperoxide reductase OsmC/OhrA|nr:OsmC family protein [Gaiellaceae bacterium]
MRPKEYAFPVAVEWETGRLVRVHVEGKSEVTVTSPPEFNRTADPSVWSPEDLFGAAAASCLAVTITGLAEREALPLRSLAVDAVGTVGRRHDGTFGFVRLEQHVAIATDPGEEQHARTLVEKAEASCLVRVSLDVDVETTVDVSQLSAASPGRGSATPDSGAPTTVGASGRR